MRTYQNAVGRLAVLSLGLIAVLLLVDQTAQAATIVWSNGANTNVWNTAGDTNFRTGGVNVAFNTNDVVSFQDQNSAPFPPGPTNGLEIFVAIDAAGVSPTSLTMNRGYGSKTHFTGGDILSGQVKGTRDESVYFERNASYSFGGGTNISAGGSNFYYTPASAGTYSFGSGPITISNGSFNFNPVSAATLTNDFNYAGGVINGNANATFSGNLTITGNVINVPADSTFKFPNVTLNQDTTINLNRCCSVAPAIQFNSNINGAGIHSISLASGNGNADWTSRVGAPAGTWDVKDITKTMRGRLQFDADNTNDFFTGLKANGGTFYHRGGMIQFRTAAGVSKTTFDLDFPFMFAPNPTYVGPAANQTGAGFYGITTLNVNDGGIVGGYGTVASTTNIGGNNPTFSLPLNVNVNNGGQIAPGMSAGNLSVLGNVNFLGDTSSLVIQLGGTVAGTSYDQLNVSGVANLNGILDVSFIDGFGDLVLNSDTFTILNAATINGMFDNLDLGRVKTSDGVGSFLASVVGSSLILSDFQLTPAPEPSTALLLGLGLVGLVSRRRKVRS